MTPPKSRPVRPRLSHSILAALALVPLALWAIASIAISGISFAHQRPTFLSFRLYSASGRSLGDLSFHGLPLPVSLCILAAETALVFRIVAIKRAH